MKNLNQSKLENILGGHPCLSADSHDFEIIQVYLCVLRLLPGLDVAFDICHPQEAIPLLNEC